MELGLETMEHFSLSDLVALEEMVWGRWGGAAVASGLPGLVLVCLFGTGPLLCEQASISQHAMPNQGQASIP